MLKRFLAIALLSLVAMAVQAADGLNTLPSTHGVAETMDRFENAVRAKGFRVFARIDHAEGAASVGLALAPTQMLIFGNPKVGTLLMQSNRRVGIALPLKALVWKDGKGVWLAYNTPAALFKRFDIDDRPAIEAKMTQLLASLAKTATMP